MFYLVTVVLISHTVFNYSYEIANEELQWLTSDSATQKKIITISNQNQIIEVEVTENDKENSWHHVYSEFTVGSGKFVHTRAKMRLIWKENSIGGGLSVSFIDKGGKRVDYVEERLTEPTQQYIPIILYAKTPPNTEKVRVSIYLHNQGKIESTEPVFYSIEEVCNEEIIRIDISKKANRHRLIGFGAEDDGRFYDKNNQQGGVNEEAIKLRQDRLNELKPHWIRTFVWFKDWNPSDDGKTFTFESDGMQSLCKTLQEYKDLNSDVNITCVDWGMKDTWEDVNKRVDTIIALMNYLIKQKKFNNIKYFTLTNEPNYFFQTKEKRFDKFVKLHEALKRSFKSNNLNLKIMGSDDAMGTDWFSACLNDKEYSSTVDLLASHFYWHYSTTHFSNELFKNRIALVEKSELNKKKPFVVTEFGITDRRFQPPSINPIMQEYEGALYTSSSIIDGLNQGVSGFSIWCMQEVRYPGSKEPMRIGLWGYADKNWQLFPIFDVLKMFTNNTKPGEKVYPVLSSNSDFVKFVKVGDKIFWANISDKQHKIILSFNNTYNNIFLYTYNIDNAIINRNKIKINNKCVALPEKSFGYIE